MDDSSSALPWIEESGDATPTSDIAQASKSSLRGLCGPVAGVSCGVEHRLFYGARKPIFRVVPDAIYPGMWRVVLPDGSLSDMANLTRAKDAAVALAERGPPRRDTRLLRWIVERA